MSLRSKIVLVLLSVVTLYVVLDNGTTRLLSGPVFDRWEEEAAIEGVERALAVVAQEVEGLEQRGAIWAGSDDVQALVGVEGARAGGATGLSSGFGRAGVDVVYVCDATGAVRWSECLDPETGRPVQLSRQLPADELSRSHPLLNPKAGQQDCVSGLMMTDHLPLLVASVPVRDDEGKAFLPGEDHFRSAAYGYVVVGRFLGGSLRERIRASAGVELDLRNTRFDELDPELREQVGRLTSGELKFVPRVEEDDDLHLYSVVSDLRTFEPLLFEATMPRTISGMGTKMLNYSFLSTISSVGLFLFLLLLLLQRVVLNPLGTLTRKTVEIGKTDDTTIRVGLERDDEIGTLATEFDSMLEKLAQSRAQLVKTARQAGMSEIATGVLHNVGNVLNSVNVSASLLSKSIQRLNTEDLEMLVEVLKKNERDLGRFVTEDPKGKHMLPFLTEIAESISRQREGLRDEVGSLSRGIDHISDLVRSQQTYAGTKGVFELASLQDELEAAVRICNQVEGLLAGTEIEREYEDLPTVMVDRHKLMEVLVNLIQNACQAMQEAGVAPRLTLRILSPTPDRVRIEVADNGVGIAEENLDRVFHHGFTTKESGHGFGLHTSANAATEMNASLHVRSEGTGHGATFYLDLPKRTAELAHAA